MRTARSGLLRATLLVSAASFCVSSAGAADSGGASIVGRWRSLENSQGVGGMFEFREGGGLEYSPGSVVEMPYRVEGDSLVLPSPTLSGAEEKLKMDWLSDDRLRLSAPGTMSIQLTRRSAKAGDQKSILGEFFGQREIEGRVVETIYLFGPNGKVLLLMPFIKTQGTYSVDGEKIRLSVPDRWSAEGTFKVDGGILTLSIADPKKGPRDSKYARY